MNYMLDKGYQL